MIKCRSPFDGRAKVSRSSISDTSSVLSKRRQSPLREFRWTRGVCLDVCSNAASLTKNFLVFAGVPQVSRKTFWRLQRRCKCPEKLFGVCNTVASISKNVWAIAWLPYKLSAGCRTHVIDRLVRQEYPTGGKGLSRLIMLSVGPMEDFSTCGFGTVSLGLTPIASPVGRMELFLLLRPDLQNRKTVR